MRVRVRSRSNLLPAPSNTLQGSHAGKFTHPLLQAWRSHTLSHTRLRKHITQTGATKLHNKLRPQHLPREPQTMAYYILVPCSLGLARGWLFHRGCGLTRTRTSFPQQCLVLPHGVGLGRTCVLYTPLLRHRVGAFFPNRVEHPGLWPYQHPDVFSTTVPRSPAAGDSAALAGVTPLLRRRGFAFLSGLAWNY